MKEGQASRTALGAAGHRAVHQVLEKGVVFADPLALAILGGADAQRALEEARAQPERRGMRFFIALRSRFAEDSCRQAIVTGVRQVLVLGAGLDTFAYRIDAPKDLRIFELDHPATQADKRRRLSDARIAEPAHLSYVAHDFEHSDMTSALVAAGLDTNKATFVLWLGVTPYLTPAATLATLAELAAFPGGVGVVFDYANPPHTIKGRRRLYQEELAARVAEAGEPFRGYLDTSELHVQCGRLGYQEIEDLDRAAIVARYLPQAPNPPKSGPGGHVARIATRRTDSGKR